MVSWSVTAMTSTLARRAACSTSSLGVGHPSLTVVCMWRSARPGETTGVHGTPGSLTIDVSGPSFRPGLAGGVASGRLDAGLRALSSACALAGRALAPEERGGDEARPGRAPNDQRRNGAADQPAGGRAQTAPDPNRGCRGGPPI